VAFIEITEAVHARIIDELLLSRAAATLALGHLLTAQAESLERQAHRTLISALIEGSGRAGSAGSPGSLGDDDGEAAARARAMGVEVTGRDLVAVVARLPGPAGTGGQVPVLGAAEAMASACRVAGVPALAGALDDLRAGALLSLPPGADDDKPLRALTARLGAAFPPGPVIGASRTVTSLR
jgi:purine catabolism regulator